MSKTYKVTKAVNLRAGASTDAPIIDILMPESRVEVIDTSGWLPIIMDDESVAWISAKYLVEVTGDELTQPPKDEGDSSAWMKVAESQLGIHEVVGGENPQIIAYHDSCTLHAKEDEVPWCSAFVNWVLQQVGYKGTQSAWAQSFATYGKKLAGPKKGCIVVFRWNDGTGHVGFVDAYTSNTVTVLGGNQSDSVNKTVFSRANVLAWVWPKESHDK